MFIFRKFIHNITQHECHIRWACKMKLSVRLNTIVLKVPLLEIFDYLLCKGLAVIVVVPDEVIWTVNWLHYLNYEPIARRKRST